MPRARSRAMAARRAAATLWVVLLQPLSLTTLTPQHDDINDEDGASSRVLRILID